MFDVEQIASGLYRCNTFREDSEHIGVQINTEENQSIRYIITPDFMTTFVPNANKNLSFIVCNDKSKFNRTKEAANLISNGRQACEDILIIETNSSVIVESVSRLLVCNVDPVTKSAGLFREKEYVSIDASTLDALDIRLADEYNWRDIAINEMFSNCHNLVELTLPDTPNRFPLGVAFSLRQLKLFGNCENLVKIHNIDKLKTSYSGTMSPSNVRSIFVNCPKLSEINLGSFTVEQSSLDMIPLNFGNGRASEAKIIIPPKIITEEAQIDKEFNSIIYSKKLPMHTAINSEQLEIIDISHWVINNCVRKEKTLAKLVILSGLGNIPVEKLKLSAEIDRMEFTAEIRKLNYKLLILE